MSKEIKFNIRLAIDGKEQLVSATSDLKEMKKHISAVNGVADSLKDVIYLAKVRCFSKSL